MSLMEDKVVWCFMAGRAGPSVALEGEMLPGMLDHIICTFFPEIWRANNGDSEQVLSSFPLLHQYILPACCLHDASLYGSMWLLSNILRCSADARSEERHVPRLLRRGCEAHCSAGGCLAVRRVLSW